MLRDRDEHRLVVRSGVNRRQAVHARRETLRDIDAQHAVHGGLVEAFEVREGGRVRRLGRPEGLDAVDGDVRVALDVPLGVHLLRRGEVGRVRVREEARVEVLDLHLDANGRVGRDLVQVLGRDELARGHVRRRRDDTHRRGVARALLDLLPVRDLLVDRCAEVDEVVRRRARGDLPRVLTVARGRVGIDTCTFRLRGGVTTHDV